LRFKRTGGGAPSPLGGGAPSGEGLNFKGVEGTAGTELIFNAIVYWWGVI